MKKKQIWIYEEDYNRLKDEFGEPGESVADWVHSALGPSFQDEMEARRHIYEALGEPHKTVILNQVEDSKPWTPEDFHKMIDYLQTIRKV